MLVAFFETFLFFAKIIIYLHFPLNGNLEIFRTNGIISRTPWVGKQIVQAFFLNRVESESHELHLPLFISVSLMKRHPELLSHVSASQKFILSERKCVKIIWKMIWCIFSIYFFPRHPVYAGDIFDHASTWRSNKRHDQISHMHVHWIAL